MKTTASGIKTNHVRIPLLRNSQHEESKYYRLHIPERTHSKRRQELVKRKHQQYFVAAIIAGVLIVTAMIILITMAESIIVNDSIFP